MPSLQEELAKRLGVALPSRQETGEHPERLADRFKHHADRKLRPLGEMSQDVKIGDVYLTKLEEGNRRNTHVSVTHITRPAIIWAIYRDRGRVQAVDVILPTTKGLDENVAHKKFRTGELVLRTAEEMQMSGANKPQRIKMHNIATLPWTSVGKKGFFFDIAGVIAQAKPAMAPHLVVRRYAEIKYNTSSDYYARIAVRPNWEYEGLSFHDAGETASKARVPELDCLCRKANTPFMGMDQDMVDRLVRWGEKNLQDDEKVGRFSQFPGVETPLSRWPNWPEWGNAAPEEGLDCVSTLQELGL